MPPTSRPPLSERRLREKDSNGWRRRPRRTLTSTYRYGKSHDFREEPSFHQEQEETVFQHGADSATREEAASSAFSSGSVDAELIGANAYFYGYLDRVGQLTHYPLAQLPLGEWSPVLPALPAVPASGETVRVQGFELPKAIGQLSNEIERSRSLLELPDDWDEAGSPGYAEKTWRRAVGLMVRIATNAWKDHRVRVESVDIVPGADGSIGLEWRVPGHELLINVPADPTKEALYYGDDGNGGGKQKGSLRTEKPNRWLSTWMAE